MAAPTETTYDITNCKCTSVKKDGLQGMDCKCDPLPEKIATKLGITGATAPAPPAPLSLAGSMSRWFVAIWLMLVIVLGISVFVYLLYRAILQIM